MILSSCTSCRYEDIDIKDSRWCVVEGKQGALCRWMFSKKEERYTAEEWSDISVGSIATDANGVGEFKKLLQKACLQMKCTYQMKMGVDKFFKHLDGLKKRRK